jgi:hypothetical protein
MQKNKDRDDYLYSPSAYIDKLKADELRRTGQTTTENQNINVASRALYLALETLTPSGKKTKNIPNKNYESSNDELTGEERIAKMMEGRQELNEVDRIAAQKRVDEYLRLRNGNKNNG